MNTRNCKSNLFSSTLFYVDSTLLSSTMARGVVDDNNDVGPPDPNLMDYVGLPDDPVAMVKETGRFDQGKPKISEFCVKIGISSTSNLPEVITDDVRTTILAIINRNNENYLHKTFTI